MTIDMERPQRSFAGQGLLSSLLPADGNWISTAEAGPGAFAVSDPSTGEQICSMYDGRPEDAHEAIRAAERAASDWADTEPRRRSDVLRAGFEMMWDETEALASLVAWENGKSLTDARSEISYAAEFLRWFGEEAVRTDGSYGPSPGGGSRTVVTRRPVGIAALITPWNFPSAMVTRKLAPALAAGCTTVLKPAPETPLTALAIAEILRLAGVPEGVVNVVPTTDAAGVVAAWLDEPAVRKVSFTGSTAVGRHLLHQAAGTVKNASMELGGNAPFVVGSGADVDVAVREAMHAKFRNGGQTCIAANRFFVHDAVHDEFVARFGAAVRDLQVGPASDPASEIGPMINDAARRRIRRLVEDAVVEGASVTARAEAPPDGSGFFTEPTVLQGVAEESELFSSEIFGPVAPIARWSDEKELLSRINASESGLAAYVFSADLGWAARLAERIDAGMVGVNRAGISDPSAPFGGTKQSGLGREGARDGLREYQETQYLSMDWTG